MNLKLLKYNVMVRKIKGIKYVNEDDVNDVLKLIRGNNLLEIAYEMLCWCVENGYVEHNS